MSVVIRLAKIGKRGTRMFHIVAAEKRSKRDSIPLEILGSYVASSTVKQVPFVKIDGKRLAFWRSSGAQLTPAVQKLVAS